MLVASTRCPMASRARVTATARRRPLPSGFSSPEVAGEERYPLGADLFGFGGGADFGREGFHDHFAAGGQLFVALGGDALQAAQVGAGAGRDEAADDDVLLEALEGV